MFDIQGFDYENAADEEDDGTFEVISLHQFLFNSFEDLIPGCTINRNHQYLAISTQSD